jgi:branched-chain amino acid transport system permease protein
MTMAAAMPASRRPTLPRSLVYLPLVVFLVAYPWLASPFWIVQIGAQSLFLGVIALSLMFLAGYGGMVSLAQITVAGLAGYMTAVLGDNSASLGLGWPWWAVLPLAVLIAVALATLTGFIASRTEGIYTIMITLAIGVAFFYFAQQNYPIFNGHSGFAGLKPPDLFGVDWREPFPFYYLSLGVAALSYLAVLYLSRSTFGLTLQAIRDNPRRMNALGFNVTLHRVAAFAVAGLIAAFGGLLLIWMNGRISPGTIGVGPVIDILIIAVLGGLRFPIGPFIGAVIFVLLQNFAIDLIDRERFNTVIGAAFLAIVLFSPDGVLGLWRHAADRLKAAGASRRGWGSVPRNWTRR